MTFSELTQPLSPLLPMAGPANSSTVGADPQQELSYTTVPELGPHVPRRGNRFTRSFFYGIMRVFGWHIEGQFPDVPKVVLLGAPHTANQDFFMAILTALSLGVDMTFVMKHSAFKGVVGSILRWLGGIGLDRDKTRNFVQQIVEVYNSREQMVMAIMPEGTRSVTAGWKSGFYYIAYGAAVPIILIIFDYPHKIMHIGPTIIPTGDYEADLQRIQSYYVGLPGKHAERTLPLPMGPQPDSISD